jgi:signal peptidase II
MPKETKLLLQRLALSLLLVAIILIADQWIKVHIKSTFEPGEQRPLFGNWLVLQYIENQGMAFGATFSTSQWGKLSLSLFRVAAIIGIAYYLFTQARKGVRKEFIIALSFILAGAMGNLIDSMFYDYIFPYDPCNRFNFAEGSGLTHMCPHYGEIEVKHTGFLYGNVVDMFRFQMNWPQWMPWLGGKEVFPAIWNLADGSITVGVFMVFFRQRKYFPKKAAETSPEDDITDEFSDVEQDINTTEDN